MNEDKSGWIGVDLDGTLAHYDKFRGIEHIGAPVPAMVERVKRWLSEGRRVKIFTARVSEVVDPQTGFRRAGMARWYIQEWLAKQGLPPLEVTNVKDWEMDELWDDRVVQVVKNTGQPSCPSPRGLGDP